MLAEADSTLVSVSGTASLRIIPGDARKPDSVSSLSIVPEHIRLEAGGDMQINAFAYGSLGQPLEGLTYSWELVDVAAGRIASIHPDGAIAELIAGDVIATFPDAIRVTGTQVIDGVSYQAVREVSVVVALPEAESVLSSVESVTGDILAITGGLVRLRAIAYDPLGRIVPEARIDWELRDPSLGEMIGSDVLNVRVGRGSYPGALLLSATLDGQLIETPIALEVTSEAESATRISAYIVPSRVTLAPGESFQFYSTVIDGTGRSVDVADEEWTLMTPGVGAVDQHGVFSGGDSSGSFPDTLVYRAVVDGAPIEASASVTLHAPVGTQLAAAMIRPAAATVAKRQPVIFTMLAQDEMGSPVPNLEYKWEVLDPQV